MWGDLSEFSTYSPHPNGPTWVGGIKAISYGSGTFQLRLKTTRAKYIAATLKNLMYVLDLAKQPGGPVRLFGALSAADQSGAEVTTGANTRIALKSGLVILGRRASKHFFIDAIPSFLPKAEDHAAFFALSTTQSSQQRAVWHARMCHMNHVAVDKVLRAHNMAPKGVADQSALLC